jgi:hypothetical protein
MDISWAIILFVPDFCAYTLYLSMLKPSIEITVFWSGTQLRAFRQATANGARKTCQLRHASFACLGVGAASISLH